MINQKQTVYLIDDDASIRHTLPRGLSYRGMQVEVYESAYVFLDAYQETFAGCIILDLRMNGMNGLELQQALRVRGIRLPIIFITGFGNIPECVQAFRAGAIDFLEKPFSPDILQHRIEEAFKQDLKTRSVIQHYKKLKARFNRLTERENEILVFLITDPDNASSKRIGRNLNISHRTVEQHRARILEKTQTKSLSELVSVAEQAGLKNNMVTAKSEY